MDISVVIPVYGCKAALGELHSRLTTALSSLVGEYEIVLVNDACPQNSWESIQDICAKDPHVKGIELSRNFGQIAAITCGLDNSTGDYVVVMDCDLQDRPEEIENLYKKALEGYDVVFSRRKNRVDSRGKVFISKLFYKFYNFVSDGNYDPEVGNFSISRREVIENYCRMRELHRAYIMYIKWLGFKSATIDVSEDARFEGSSSYTFKKRLKMAGDIMTSQSARPLSAICAAGVILTLLSLLALIPVIIFAPAIYTLLVCIFLMGGIITACIGLVAIYIGNIFMQSKQRPIYVIRTVLNGKENKDIR